jgi:hypothetical protein
MFLSGCLAHSRMKATRALPSCSWWGGESGEHVAANASRPA